MIEELLFVRCGIGVVLRGAYYRSLIFSMFIGKDMGYNNYLLHTNQERQ